MNTRRIGTEYEELACKLLEQAGMTVLERNFRVRAGEIDIIAKDGSELVFVEVKYRKDCTHGGAKYAISEAKKNKIRKVAQWYLAKNHLSVNRTFCRFDAVLIDGDTAEHIRNAW